MTDDEEFAREVYVGSYRRLVVQMYGVCGDLVEAEDAVQEAFIRALTHTRRFRRVDNPEAWLRTVALNVLRSRWRKIRNFTKIQHRLEQPTDVPGMSEEQVLVMSALRRLPSTQAHTIALHYMADLSVQQVAHTLGVAEGTVKARLSRGRARLADMLTASEVNDHA